LNNSYRSAFLRTPCIFENMGLKFDDLLMNLLQAKVLFQITAHERPETQKIHFEPKI